ncbi:MAG: hypothetical protein GY898_27765 [Proteobacteria bacterium]|nr:hypothetical protein [Pseudomonadota bacterium]
MFLGLLISLAAPLAATAGDLGPEVEQIVGDLLALPGWEIRGTYLAELTQTAEPDLAERLDSARQLLELLEPQEPSPARLRALLRMAVDPGPEVRAAALAAAAGDVPVPIGDAAPAGPDPPVSTQQPSPGPEWLLTEVEGGVGRLTWRMPAYQAREILGDAVRVQSADDFDGPRYPSDLVVLTTAVELYDCTGDLSFFFGENGLLRAWFVASEPSCWPGLNSEMDNLLGPGRTERRETPADVLRVRLWDGDARATLFVTLKDDEPVGSVILHVQPGSIAGPTVPEASTLPPDPTAQPPVATPPVMAEPPTGVSATEEARRARRRRGSALKARAELHLATGVVLAVLGGAGGATSLAVVFLREWDEASAPLGITFAVGGVVAGVVGTGLLIAGGSMDIGVGAWLGVLT